MIIKSSKLNLEFDCLIHSSKLSGVNLGLERIKSALFLLGKPCNNIPAIQVAGTNGKGSIACFLESCLIKTQIKTGCTTSPHLIDWCERIKVNGQMISLEDFSNSLKHIKSIIKDQELTPFELVIASAFNYFATQKVELMILEVGLGGRLDATTAHPFRPFIAIGGIGLDHCEHLGKTLKDIALEKVAVITPGSKVFSAKQMPEVAKVIEETVAKNNATLTWSSPLSKDWELGIRGEIQRENAAVAKNILEALPDLGFQINREQIKQGLASANWPGRMQYKKWLGNTVILDGAHNPHAIEQLSKERQKLYGEAIAMTWIVGIQSQKNAPEMLRILLKKKDIAWIVPIPNHSSWNKKEIIRACPELLNKIYSSESIKKVFHFYKKTKQWPSPAPLITGSLYLIGDILPSLDEAS